MTPLADASTNMMTAREIFERHEEVFERGHEDYMREARELEDMYLGGGRQWRPEDRAILEAEGRPCWEVDITKPAVNAAAGYQIANRVDISFVPRGGAADEFNAKLQSKVVRQILDNNRWRQKETQVFLDGLIQRRGYFDIRMNYDDSPLGEVKIRVPDPLDCLPDPDANSLDPDDWSDYMETRWLNAAQLEWNYGEDAAKEIVARGDSLCEHLNHGEEHGILRAGFNERLVAAYSLNRAFRNERGPTRRYRVIERQVNEYQLALTAVFPGGDERVVEGMDREYIAQLIEQGIPVIKRRKRRVRFQVAAPDVAVFNEIAPFSHFTVVPYFPFFRRGRSTGMLDSLKSTQEMLNKFVSQFAHIVNTSANSGWQGESGQLDNMSDQDLVNNGGKTGLVLLRRPGTPKLEKITPNQIPTGIDRMIELSHLHAKMVSGMDDTLLGNTPADLSGVAIQSLQFASQQKLALPLDNLSWTRQMVAVRTQELTQRFYGAERIMRIAEEDMYGVTRYIPTVLNQRMPDGTIVNDLTMGTYDLVMSEQPGQVTFDNSQFQQLKDMREMGINVPEHRIIRASNLADKSEIAEEMAKAAGQVDPVVEAETRLKNAQAEKAEAAATNSRVEGMFSAVKTAREIVLTPQTASLADVLLRSAGFKDQDAAPLLPSAPAAIPGEMAAPGPENSNPLTPTNPDVGLDTGLGSTT